jgi:hypothetical protein
MPKGLINHAMEGATVHHPIHTEDIGRAYETALE